MMRKKSPIAGLIFGFTAFVISILNYRRDRPKLIVALEWDAVVVRDKQGTQGTFGRVYVTNAGRRPIYVTAAGIELVNRRTQGYIRRTMQGKEKGRRLAEGDPPLSLIVDADSATGELLMAHRDSWREFRAFAIDSTGKKYLSPLVKQRPSWGTGDGRSPRWLSFPARIIECDLEQQQFESTSPQASSC